MRRFWAVWAPLSIALKLPLGLAAVLIVALGGMAAAAYVQVRSSVLQVASERLDRGAHQITDLLVAGIRQRAVAIRALADEPAVRAHLDARTTVTRRPVGEAVEQYLSANRQAVVAVDILDADGRPLLTFGAELPPLGAPALQALLRAPQSQGGAAFGGFQLTGSDLTLGTVAVIRDGDRMLGYVMDRRRVRNNGQAAGILTGLIGSHATLLIGSGSPGDGVWTDLSSPVPPPPLLGADEILHQYVRGGPSVLARVVAVPGTPWLVVVEFPAAETLAPVRRFLFTAIGLSLLLIAGGAGAGWALSHRLTTSLRQVTDAAEAIAAYGSAARLEPTRRDEVGRLAVSFNTMADEVGQSRQRLESLIEELESRVSERTAALEAANRDLEGFSYSVSHDLRAPVRAIGGFARILQDDHPDELSPVARQRLDVIVQQTQYMGRLIDGLLLFSRLGREPLERQPIDMTALAQAAISEVRQSQPDRAIEVRVGPLPPARGESLLVRQVWANFLQNAAKFTRTRVQPRVDIGCLNQNGQDAYFVRDNGVGFDMAYADQLFGVFQRLHSAEDFEGTGVGLAIVQRIVARHGGRVWAEGVVDRGATFFFTLPADVGDA